MSLWSSLKSLFKPLDRGFLVRDGHELKWGRSQSVPVYFHPDTPDRIVDALRNSTRRYNDLIGRDVFFWPMPAVEPMLPYFADAELRKLFSDTNNLVLFECKLPSDNLGRSSIYYDKRNGRMRSVLLECSSHARLHLVDEIIDHELGHVLGLDHDDDKQSIMYGTIKVNWSMVGGVNAFTCSALGRVRRLSQADLDRLKRAYT